LRSKKKREADGGGMATRRALQLRPAANWVATRMEGLGRVPRYFSDKTSGRVLSEEERAAENVYIQKMEREKLEKLRKKADMDKAEAAKRAAAAGKKGEGAHPS
jgi:hypothetical protein